MRAHSRMLLDAAKQQELRLVLRDRDFGRRTPFREQAAWQKRKANLAHLKTRLDAQETEERRGRLEASHHFFDKRMYIFEKFISEPRTLWPERTEGNGIIPVRPRKKARLGHRSPSPRPIMEKSALPPRGRGTSCLLITYF